MLVVSRTLTVERDSNRLTSLLEELGLLFTNSVKSRFAISLKGNAIIEGTNFAYKLV
jgi:hypothetical protein